MGSRASLSFVIGRAGVGKTRWCFDRIVDLLAADPLGPPVWLVTLRQATLETSRAFMLHSGLPAVSRLRVVSFDRLRDEVLAECGGNALPQLTATGRRLLMSHLLRQHADSLSFFGPVAARPGTADELCALLDELDRAGQTVDDLAEVINSSDDPALTDPQVRAKAADLVMIGHAYRTALAGRIDPGVRQQAVLDALPTCSLARRSHVFVDGFWDFDLPDRRLLAALADHASSITVTATVDGVEQTDHFHRTAESFTRLRQTLDPDGHAHVERLTTQRRWADPHRNLAQLADRWLIGRGQPVSPRGITFVEAHDLRAEVREVACTVREALRSGLRQRDCLVLVRDLSTYETALREVFDQHGLRFFSDQRRPASHMPLVRMVRALLRVALEGWPHDATMALIKTGLAGMTADDADRLERYVNLHRIRGEAAWTDADDWQFRRRPHRNDDGEPNDLLSDESPAIDTFRRTLAKHIAPLRHLLNGAAIDIADAVRLLYRTMSDLGVPATLAAQIDEQRLTGNEEHAAEIEQTWQAFCDVLDQFHELLGTDRTTPDDFVADVFIALDGLDLALAPPTVDAVLVGEVERVRIDARPLVAVMGLSDTLFPATPTEPVLLGDATRKALTTHDLHLQRDSERRLLDERFLMYHAITRCSDRLVLTRPCHSASAPLEPSAFWMELRAAVPQADVRTEPSAPVTAHDLVGRVTSWAHGADDARSADLYAALREHTPRETPVVQSAWDALNYSNRPSLDDRHARELFGGTFVGSISRLESRGRCAFRHFAEYGLALADEESDELTARDVGTLFHDAAEHVFDRLIDAGHDFRGPEPSSLDRLVAGAVDDLAGRLRGRIWLSAGRNRYERERLTTELGRTLRHQLSFLRGGVFTPVAVEARFGEQQPWPAPTGDGYELRGRIDRIDQTADGFASVIDYKTSQKQFNAADLGDGIGVQLPVYLLAVRAAGMKPAGAFFVGLREGLTSVLHPSKIVERVAGPEPRGIFNADLIDRFDRAADTGSELLKYKRVKKTGALSKTSVDPLEDGRLTLLLDTTEQIVADLAVAAVSPDVRPHPWRRGKQSACTYCSFRSVCRHEPRRNGYRRSSNLCLPQLLGEEPDA